ncbi:MAG: PxKF domain-containing protein, partial [Anaerolineae bacterium]|nr:PxKF domain-containing protein [Anaerolineae bacterium]
TSDALSGVATAASLSTSGGPGVGTFTATCSGATDKAGNAGASASVTYSVVYNFSGFLRPVDNLPTLNQVKAGSAVPVKFSLNGNQGLSIFYAGFPKSMSTSCTSSAPVDAIDEIVTAGSSSLSYDASTEQYNYVWKTEKSWTGCRQLVVKLIDGIEYRANFKFTK